MTINSILSLFTPKDIRFFPLLSEMSEVLDQAGDFLVQLFSTQEKELGNQYQICKKIKEQEIRGDLITHQIFKALNETFITPFDREDISSLTDEMDNALDTINRSAQKVVMYSPSQSTESMLQLSRIIRKGTHEVLLAIRELPCLKTKKLLIRSSYKTLKHMKEEADIVCEKGVAELFRSDKNPFEIMKLKEIIQELEKSTYKMNSVGKVLKYIFIKYT